MKDYYKKIDKSFFNYGITIPKDYVQYFTHGNSIELGTSRDVTIIWKKKEYNARLSHVDRKAGDVHQIRWDNNKELLTSLKQEFIQSYFAIESQNYAAKEQKKILYNKSFRRFSRSNYI